MTRRALRALLSSALLLSALPLACTSRDAPPEPSGKAPAETPPTPPTPPTPTPSTIAVTPIPVPEGAALEWVRANACEDGAPMSLTASDGTGLRLASLTARAVVEGPLAFTELRLSFDNPQDRQLEGRFSITLPPGAAISRFAMQIDGRWQEGEVVERQAARVAYEDFLHRRQDPALLESDAGNVFQARVFPIPPRARKELVLSYSQELAHEAEPYRLPLCGLPELDLLDVDVAIVQGAAAADTSLGGLSTQVYHLDLKREKLAPTKDLEARVGKVPAQGLRSGDLAVVRVVPVLEAPPQPVTAMTILMDTSASRALDFTGQVARLGELVAALPGAAQVHVVAFDQSAEAIYSGRADGVTPAVLERLKTRGAMGASDLSQALAALPMLRAVSPRLLLVGDGVVTAGADEAGTLQERLRALASAGLQRVDAIVDGGIQDATMLAALTRPSLASDGVVLDARLPAATLAERLGQATRSGVKVEVPGAEWVWPTTLDGVQPGDERLVYALLPPELPLEVRLAGAAVRDPKPVLAVVPEPLLARAHAQARIADLQAKRAELPADDRERRKALADEIVQLSVRHRVLSDLTALLVLETENDYARFGIDRRALADILVAGPSGVEKLRRVDPVVPEPKPEQEEPGWIARGDADKDGAKNEAKRDEGGRTGGLEADAKAAFGGRDDAEQELAAAPADAAGGDDGAFDDGQRHRGEEGTMGRPSEPGAADPFGSTSRGSGGGGVLDAPAAADEAPRPAPEPELAMRRERPASRRPLGVVESRLTAPPPETPPIADPYDGRFATVMNALGRGELDAAEREATTWRGESPGDVLALVAVGEVLEARGRRGDAARAYGSIVDLFPGRADLRRMAGERLERLGGDALALAIDTYAHAVEQRPDHPSSHRLYAYALLKAGRHAEAFAALEAALDRSYPGGRFAGVDQLLREDLGLLGAALIASDPSQRKRVEESLAKHGVTLPTAPSTRFVLNWETDANDVDLHVYDAKGGHAFFSNRTLPSGGELIADVTTGYGPECLSITGKRSAGPYRVLAHYYARGPMGYGMGKLQVVEHDGAGALRFSEQPFVVMKDGSYVDLATVGSAIAEAPGAAGTFAPATPEERPGKVLYVPR